MYNLKWKFLGNCLTGFIIQSQSVHEGRIYQLKLFCDKDYPEKPPSVRFHSRINMTCVNHETGVVIYYPYILMTDDACMHALYFIFNYTQFRIQPFKEEYLQKNSQIICNLFKVDELFCY